MRPALASPLSPLSPPPVARLGSALAASVLAHWALLASLLPDAPWGAGAIRTRPALITVRLSPLPAPVPPEPVSPDPELHRAPEPAATAPGSVARLQSAQERGPARSSASARQTSSERIDPDPVFQGPDPNYYTARDLDSYPRPLAPLQLDVLRGERMGDVRLEILIDEAGVVQEVILMEAARAGPAEDELRAALAAARFHPARKDGRAVRSRLLLSVGPNLANER
jgi:protein TonB